MICPKCGKEIDGSVRFCPECGTRIEAVAEQATTKTGDVQQKTGEGSDKADSVEQENAAQGTSVEKVTSGMDSAKSAGKNKKLPAKMIGILCAVAVCMIVIAALFLTHRPTVNMSDYITVSYEGYDSVGRASASFDYDAFRQKYEGKLKFNKKHMISILEEYDGFDAEKAANDVEDAIEAYDAQGEDLCVEFISDFFGNAGSFDRSSKLSNGDVITYSWENLNSEDELEQLGKALGCKIKCDPIECTVSDLEAIETVDPFQNVSVTFSGVSPEGTVEISNDATDELGRSLCFTANKTSGLSNGDVITVSVSGSGDDEYYAEQYGKLLSSTKKDYTVEGLQHYITSVDEIPEDVLNSMKRQADDVFDAYHAKNYSSTEMLKGREFIGTYLLSPKASVKTDNYGDFHCAVYLCYRIDVEDYHEDKTVLYDQVNTYYSLCRFTDIITTDDGGVSVDLSDYSSPESDQYKYKTVSFGNGSNIAFYLNGYGSLDDMYKDIVQTKADKYDVENKVKDVETDYQATYCSTIPDTAKEYNGHYYLCVNAGNIAWEEAKKRCEAKGGHLVTITSEDEMAWILRNLEVSSNDEYWIGCSMDQNGNWTWVTGEKFDYSNWADYNPRATKGEMYYVKTSVNGQWINTVNESSSWYMNGYILEWDGALKKSEDAKDSKSAADSKDADQASSVATDTSE